MEVLGHLIFEVIKIAILSSAYASVLFLIIYIYNIAIYKYIPITYFQKNFKSWLFIWCIVYVVLFAYMFSYFGDHGLGDSATIPIGHSKVVNQTDGVSAYLQNNKGDQISIKLFCYDNENLYAQTENEKNGGYVIWNLSTDKWKLYKTQNDYLKEIQKHNYPPYLYFKDFWYFYNSYWNGWRFWLLP